MQNGDAVCDSAPSSQQVPTPREIIKKLEENISILEDFDNGFLKLYWIFILDCWIFILSNRTPIKARTSKQRQIPQLDGNPHDGLNRSVENRTSR